MLQVNEGVRLQENTNQLEWLQERVNLEGIEEVSITLMEIYFYSNPVNCHNVKIIVILLLIKVIVKISADDLILSLVFLHLLLT